MPNLIQVVKALRENFGDDYLFFTFVPFSKNKQLQPSTFASDNISYLDNWILMQQTKLQSGSLDIVIFVVRRFLKGEKNKFKNENGLKIPKKEIFHFSTEKKHVVGRTEEETYYAQNTDCKTGEDLKPEKGLIYVDSQVLIKEMFSLVELNLDKILDKINNYGMENLAKYELNFLKSKKKQNEKVI